MDKEYITIEKFANLQGISKQAVYERLEKDLKPYTAKLNKLTIIDTKALKDNTMNLEPEQREKLKELGLKLFDDIRKLSNIENEIFVNMLGFLRETGLYKKEDFVRKSDDC